MLLLRLSSLQIYFTLTVSVPATLLYSLQHETMKIFHLFREYLRRPLRCTMHVP